VVRVPGSVRVGAAWLLAVPFLLFARPTPLLLLVGGCVAAVGLAVRGWAAGCIAKGWTLTTWGAYAFTRNPMYLGSFAIGLGLTVIGGHWIWPSAFAAFFLAVYVPTMRREAEWLSESFDDRFEEYAASVPVFFPRLSPFRSEATAAEGFQWSRYVRHREWEALLGVGAALVFLALKLR